VSELLPPVDETTAPWWEGTREGWFLLQRCHACAAVQFPPRSVCVTCMAADPEWVEASGHARVDSFTVVHRSPAPEQIEAPYVVARVVLEEGPIVLSRLVGDDVDAWRCDDPVSLHWEPLADGRRLPVFGRVPR
jgi:uncharacterized OB-fold protein